MSVRTINAFTPQINTKSEVPCVSPLVDRLYAHITSSCIWGPSLDRRDFEQINGHTLHQLLDELFSKLEGQDVNLCISRLAEILPLESLQQAVRAEYPNYTDALDAAKKMLYEAKYYLEKTGNREGPTLYARFTKIFHQILYVLESLINAFGIAGLFKPSE
ncbi:MAG TPA: hypothetical protein VLG44_08665, partial [Chlamydiales bacterium]|nr:hypothetical protein [Chlamydiales bacterium]